MEILIAKSAGFCFGVKRAINIAVEHAGKTSGEIYTLGPIIHNPQVVKKLEETTGIRPKKSVEEMAGGTVIIRSHGVGVGEMEKAGEKGLSIVDATCPFVKRAQDIVRELTRESYAVVVVGEKEHPEVQGIISYGGAAVTVAAKVEDLKNMPRAKKIGIVAQTTQSIEKLKEIASFCIMMAEEVKIFNTICSATSVRQRESVELSKTVDCMIVVGGKNSANTRRLAEICRSIQSSTHHIETAGEIESEWLTGIGRLGITAGASTAEWIIEDVVKRICEIDSNKGQA